MSIRILALFGVVMGLSIYAWKDWFVSLCGLILMMAFIEHPDMPKGIFGVQGLNLWNVLFLSIALAWVKWRRRERPNWDMPPYFVLLMTMYVGIIVLGVLRAAFDLGDWGDYSLRNLISEELINTIKWLLPAIMLFDGCRSRRQVILALTCILLMLFFFAVQVVRVMPLEAALGDNGVINRARMNLGDEVGYSAADLAVLLAGSCWGIIAFIPFIHNKLCRFIVLMAAGVVVFAGASTGGRGGYVSCGITGLVLCLVKWRRYLLVAPVIALLLPVVLPGATARMLQGFGQVDAEGHTSVDEEALSAGRLEIWPYVVEKISESPWIGYGRQAQIRTGLARWLSVNLRQTFGHPHNMYLELLMDNGILGAVPILAVYTTVIWLTLGLFRSKNRLYSAVGGLGLALVLSNLIAGITGQHYYPQEHTLGIWAAMFLSLRVHVEETKAKAGLADSIAGWNNSP